MAVRNISRSGSRFNTGFCCILYDHYV